MAKTPDSVLSITDPDAPDKPLAQPQQVVAAPAPGAPIPGLKLAEPLPLAPPKVFPKYLFDVRITLNGNTYGFEQAGLDEGDAINSVYDSNPQLRAKFTRCRATARKISDTPIT